VADGQRVAGIYRRSVMLASGRYATLDDGIGFSLVPWKPLIEPRLGKLWRLLRLVKDAQLICSAVQGTQETEPDRSLEG